MRFLQTKKKGNSHYHIVYVNDLTGNGITSVDKNHYHEVVLTPDLGWIVQPANNHVHELTTYIPKSNNSLTEESDLVNEILTLYEEAKEYEKKPRKFAYESEEFYNGEGQWKKSHKTELESKQRAVLTINEIESKIDLLSGYQRKNRTDIRVLPTEEGDQRVADILNVVLKNIAEQTNYAIEETDVFLDQCIAGRGCFNIYVDYDKNWQGDIVIEKFDWDEVYFGPHNKKDCSDLEYLIKEKWFSSAKIKQLYPDKKNEITAMFTPQELRDVNDVHTQYTRGQYVLSNNELKYNSLTEDLVDIQKKQIKVLECWQKEYTKEYVFANIKDDFYFNADGWAKEDINKVYTIPDFEVIEKKVHRMRVTTLAGYILLDDDYPDLAIQDFHIIPVYAKKRKQYWWGKVHSVKDPQREVNKRHSQLADILNKVASYGWFYDDDTFDDPVQEKQFIESSSTPGFTVKVRDTNKIPQKEEGVKFPSELANMLAIESEKIKEIMNINNELMGIKAKASYSGIALMQQKVAALMGNEFLFDNLAFAKKKLWKLVISYIQKVYTPERILRIIENQNIKEPVQIGSIPYNEIDKQVIYNLLQNADLTKYDVTISESPYSPTTRIANFVMWSELASKGLPIPPEILVDLSDLPDKEKVMQAIQSMKQSQLAEEQMKYKMEIDKTMLANQAKRGIV